MVAVCLAAMTQSLWADNENYRSSTQLNQMEWNRKVSELESPILTLNNVLFFPLMDFAKISKSTFSYDRGQDLFRLAMPNTGLPITVAPRSREIWIDRKPAILDEQSVMIDSQLYVPLKSFLKIAGFSYEITGNMLRVFTPVKTVSYAPASKNTLLFNRRTQTESKRLPRLDPNQPLMLRWKNKTVEMRQFLVYRNNTLFFPIEFVFPQVEPAMVSSAFSVTIENAKFQFRDDKSVLKTSDPAATPKYLDQPFFTQSNYHYIPLISALEAMDLTYRWDEKARTITILNPVQSIVMVKQPSENYRLEIKSSYPISDIGSTSNRNISTIFLKDADLSLTQIRGALSASSFHLIHAKQLDESTGQLTIYNKRDTGVQIKKADDALSLEFAPAVYKIKQETRGGDFVVTLYGVSKDQVKTWKTQSPPRFVVDIKDAKNMLENRIKADSPQVLQIRTSQLETNPLMTRVVFDLDKPSQIALSQPKTGVVAVTFSSGSGQELVAPSHTGLTGKRIAIDTGHGGNDPGAINPAGIYEKGYTKLISDHLKELLEGDGATVIMVRPGDTNPTLGQRVEMAENEQADILVSVHINSFTKPHVNGTETFYYKDIDRPLANEIHNAMISELGRKDNGLRHRQLYVLNRSHIPAALAEPLYFTNPDEQVLLDSPEIQQKIAEAIFHGIQAYFQKLP